jgi:flagellar motor protein MotB
MRHSLPPLPEDPKEFAPLWITTFADLISQLFAFFVLLLVMGKTQEAGMLGAVRESFVYSMKHFGLSGSLYGRDEKAGPHAKPVYSVDKPEQTGERTLDAKASELHALYQELMQSVDVATGRLVGSQVTYLPKNIAFRRGVAILSNTDKELLTREMAELKANLPEKEVKIYILGLASGEKTEWQQWTISAKRAEAVAEFMRGILPEGLGWQVYSWGAGKGGEWTSKEGQMAKEADIMVAVLRK